MPLSSSSISSGPHRDVSAFSHDSDRTLPVASGIRKATPPTVHPQQPQQPTIRKAQATTSQPHQNDTYFSLSSFAPRSSGLFSQPFPVLQLDCQAHQLFWHHFRSVDIYWTMLDNHKLPFLVHSLGWPLCHNLYDIAATSWYCVSQVLWCCAQHRPVSGFTISHHFWFHQHFGHVPSLCSISIIEYSPTNSFRFSPEHLATSFRSWANGSQKSIIFVSF